MRNPSAPTIGYLVGIGFPAYQLMYGLLPIPLPFVTTTIAGLAIAILFLPAIAWPGGSSRWERHGPMARSNATLRRIP